MLTHVVLIIDKRKELPAKYKKLLEHSGMKVFVSANIASSLDVLSKYEPDLVIISDSIDEDVSETCKKIRILSYQFRPIVIALSKSAHTPDMLNALNSGADDYLSEPIDPEEFKARINAHLRRHFESNINDTTHLFDSKITYQYLRRLLVEDDAKFSVMLTDIDNFDFYRQIYGDIAADKMLQTYQAIITSVLDKEDYLGHLGKNDFVLITKSQAVEKMASYLVYAFDMIAEKFYSQSDVSRGYMIMQGDENAGKPTAIVSTSIGIISNEHKKYTSVKQLIHSLISTHQLAKMESKSKYIYERPKISTEDAVSHIARNINLLIVEPDEALSYLLFTAASMQGYHPEIINSYDHVFDTINDFNPGVIILDTGDAKDPIGLQICRKIKNTPEYSKIKTIVTSTIHDKMKVFDAHADVYLPKPYDLVTMFSWVKKLFDECNS